MDKEQTISIRLSNEEYTQIEEAAISCDMTMSGYIRHVVFSTDSAEVTAIKTKAMQHISRMCNTLNKLEHFIYDEGKNTYKELREDVKNLWNTF